jgi:hypothetical protein
MALNPSPQRQSVVTFPTPNVNDILFFESVDAERVGTDIPEYGSKHPDYKKWPDHRLVYVQSVDEQSRYYRYYYAADQLDQDNDNWSFSEADIGGTKFDAVTRDYVVRRSEFNSELPAMGSAMPDVPANKFNGTYVLSQRKQVPISDKILSGLYVIEQRVYVKKVPLYKLNFDDFFRTTNYIEQTLYHKGEKPDSVNTIEYLVGNRNNDYWGMNNGVVRTAQQLSDNWYSVTEQEVVKCNSVSDREELQTNARSSITTAIANKTPSDRNLFSTYSTGSLDASDPLTRPSLVRNANCWAHNLKGVTGFVAYNNRLGSEGDGKFHSGVAITPKHILYAEHDPYEVDDVVYFCSRNSEIYARKILAVKNHPSGGHGAGDFGIAILDADLPAAIDIVKVLPKDAYQYFQLDEFGTLSYVNRWTTPPTEAEEVLVLQTDAEEKAHIRKIQNLDFKDFDYRNPADTYGIFDLTTATGLSAWSETIVSGDSGSPATLVINGECVLLGLLTTAEGVGGFVSAPRNFRDINDLISSIDSEYETTSLGNSALPTYFSDGYQLNTIDLGAKFTSHRPEEGGFYSVNDCARLQYETVITYNFPPILQDVQFDVWNLRSGGARTYPRVLYSKGSFRGPCRAVVDISWSTTKPVGLEAGKKPAPEPISIQNPLFTLSIPPTLHEAVNFTVSINNDETWNNTGAVYNKNATNVTSWEPHIISSEVKPFRGGWLMETVTVYPPS